MRRALFFLMAAGWLTAGPNPPSRIAVSVNRASIAAGEPVMVRLELRDAYNQAAAAPREYRIRIEVSEKGAVVFGAEAVIPRGQTWAEREVRIPRAGTFMVKALHPELREDAVFVRARATRAMRFETAMLVPASWQPEPAAAAEAAPPGGGLWLDVMYSIAGAKLAANGADRMKIVAFLSGRASQSISLRFQHDAGVLTPNPLLIPAGQDFGETYLTSQRAGVVRVSFLNSLPPNGVKLRSGGSQNVEFEEAAKELRVMLSPPVIALGDGAEVQVQVLDLGGEALLQKKNRPVYLTIGSGAAECEPYPLVIPKDSMQGACKLTPRSLGAVSIAASSFGVSSRAGLEQLQVYFPYRAAALIFLLSALAYLLVKWAEAAGVWAKARAAAVAGLSALAVCGLTVLGLNEQIPPKVILHPMGALTIAILVGLGVLAGGKLKDLNWDVVKNLLPGKPS